MKTNDELRGLAWDCLWREGWFGRLLGGFILLLLCAQAVQIVVGMLLTAVDAQTWADHMLLVARNRYDLTTPVPQLRGEYLFRLVAATCFVQFISLVLSGIFAFGMSKILLMCLARDTRDWLPEAFAGYKDPFGMFWLQFRLMLIYLGWELLAFFVIGVVMGALSRVLLVPVLKSGDAVSAAVAGGALSVFVLVVMTGAVIVPFYRYRFLWLVKASHPDWGAGRCLLACRQLTDGQKLRSFYLDCSYWKPITLVLGLAAAMVGLVLLLCLGAGGVPFKLLGSILLFVLVILFVAGLVFVSLYVSVGQSHLFAELRERPGALQTEG